MPESEQSPETLSGVFRDVTSIRACSNDRTIRLVTTLLVLGLCLWHPVLPHCQDHAEGVFEQKYLFIHQLINTSSVGFFYCLYPLLLLMLDINRLRAMSTSDKKAVNPTPLKVGSYRVSE
ncbi:hypothetical protein Y032_0044g960 [Ancylostoma ceylanicum]|nr:hypothetical protein Y032_0044g960 [Ancylostoma ceylanicum]